MKTILSLIVLTALVAGCGNNKKNIPFDGEFFRTKVSKVDGQRDVFTVSVRDVSRSIDGAIEAGRHAGNAYCVETYGSSKIDWSVGPDTPAEELVIEDDTIVFQGVCPQL